MITLAPIRRDASTVCTRWFATVWSIVGTPVMSITTTFARLVRMPRSSCSVSCARALRVEHADDREDQQPLAHLQDRRRQLADRLLLLADDPLALLHEGDADGVGDAVRGRLVGVEDAVEQVEVGLVLLEQRAREHVAQEQHDAEHLVGLDAAGDDPLGEVAGVVLERLDRAGLEHLDVVVVDRGRLGEDLLRGHRREQLRVGDAPRPLLPQLRAVAAEVGDELAQQRAGRLAVARGGGGRRGRARGGRLALRAALLRSAISTPPNRFSGASLSRLLVRRVEFGWRRRRGRRAAARPRRSGRRPRRARPPSPPRRRRSRPAAPAAGRRRRPRGRACGPR